MGQSAGPPCPFSARIRTGGAGPASGTGGTAGSRARGRRGENRLGGKPTQLHPLGCTWGLKRQRGGGRGEEGECHLAISGAGLPPGHPPGHPGISLFSLTWASLPVSGPPGASPVSSGGRCLRASSFPSCPLGLTLSPRVPLTALLAWAVPGPMWTDGPGRPPPAYRPDSLVDRQPGVGRGCARRSRCRARTELARAPPADPADRSDSLSLGPWTPPAPCFDCWSPNATGAPVPSQREPGSIAFRHRWGTCGGERQRAGWETARSRLQAQPCNCSGGHRSSWSGCLCGSELPVAGSIQEGPRKPPVRAAPRGFSALSEKALPEPGFRAQTDSRWLDD